MKDLFIFSCYTGLSYIDVINLTEDNINIGIDGELWIIKRREKTNKLLRIPILPKAKKLIDKYKTNLKSVVNGTIFPKISNQKLNSYLKEVADVCSIKKNLIPIKHWNHRNKIPFSLFYFNIKRNSN